MTSPLRHGGDHLANVLQKWNIDAVFTLCGGHISPILVGCESRKIKVVDCRDERNAVFAADAWARMTGKPGVAAVTAGPGVTNTLTAIKNAQLAQSPLVLLGGATATVLRGRGALQDIDQLSLIHSAVKWAARCTTVKQLGPTLERAFKEATGGVPGPVFVEVPVDVLYPESIVSEWFIKETGVEHPKTLGQRALKLYLQGHLLRQFHAPHVEVKNLVPEVPKRSRKALLAEAAELLSGAERPALVVGSQTMVNVKNPATIAAAIERLGLPVWLGGTARGLLGKNSPLQFRHARGKALKDADVVVICGFPFDFRLKYGFGIGKKTKVIAANLSAEELTKNRKADVAVQQHAGEFLEALARLVAPQPRWKPFLDACRQREAARDEEISKKARTDTGDKVDPILFFQKLEQQLSDDSVLVVDGGDFVATAAYVLKPRGPLSWLDPGVFGTLGVGGGFAVGAATVRPKAEVWIIYGDGSSAYSLSEFDTFVRHGYAPIAVVGTDASWQQIARDQVTLLGSSIGTGLRFTSYEKVAEGYGGKGLLLTDPKKIDETIAEAKRLSRAGTPVCINVHLAKTDFREGSISI